MEFLKNAKADIKIKVVEGRIKHKVEDANFLGVMLCIDDLIRFIQKKENVELDFVLEIIKEVRDATSVINPNDLKK